MKKKQNINQYLSVRFIKFGYLAMCIGCTTTPNYMRNINQPITNMVTTFHKAFGRTQSIFRKNVIGSTLLTGHPREGKSADRGMPIMSCYQHMHYDSLPSVPVGGNTIIRPTTSLPVSPTQYNVRIKRPSIAPPAPPSQCAGSINRSAGLNFASIMSSYNKGIKVGIDTKPLVSVPMSSFATDQDLMDTIRLHQLLCSPLFNKMK